MHAARPDRLIVLPEHFEQAPARPREPRHHGANRHFGRFRDFPIVEAFDITQHERFAEWRRQFRDRRAQLLRVDLGNQRPFRRVVATFVGFDMRKLDRWMARTLTPRQARC